MDSGKLIKFCSENSVLLDRDSLDFFNSVNDFELVYKIILKFKSNFGKKFISKYSIFENLDYIKEVSFEFCGEDKVRVNDFLEKITIFAGIDKKDKDNGIFINDYEIIPKKVTVGDFSNYFRSRFNKMKEYFENKRELSNLISVNKLPRDDGQVSIIGLVYDKKITKNGNVLLEVEDLTGKVKVLLNRERFFDILDEVSLDCIIAINGVGGKEIIFANDIFFCGAELMERKKSNTDESVAFIGDLHIGSKEFLEDEFLKFIDFLNSDEEEAVKIKYLTICGDLISGIGVYPGQEDDLEIKNISDQYNKAYELLSKIRSDIKIMILSGNHDGVRLAEPQPKINKKYSEKIYSMENIFILNNPTNFIIGKNKEFSGFNILAYHGFSYIYYLNNISKFVSEKAIDAPEKFMYYFLKNRHLAPTYSSAPCFPDSEDKLIINKIPDIFISGHLHKTGVGYYNNILMVSCSSWEAQMPYQKKFGLNPDLCKVPIFNLKSGSVKVLDFENKEVEDGN